MKHMKHALHVLAAILTLAAGSASADTPVPIFDQPINFNSSACANYGDFQSCSGQYLNFLATGDPSGSSTIDYVTQSSEGLLKTALVLLTDSQAAVDNTDLIPGNLAGTANVDNAYTKLGNVPPVYGTSVATGENGACSTSVCDPSTFVKGEVNNGGNVGNSTAWDVSLQSLLNVLTTPDGIRHDLLIFFDNNQTGVTEDQDILVSALVCVRKSGDVNPVTGQSATDHCFQLVDQDGTNTGPFPPGNATYLPNGDPSTYQTNLSYGDSLQTPPVNPLFPNAGPVRANGTFCVDNTSKQVVAFNVASSNSCPANSTFINNNLGSNLTEFIAGIPELNGNLENYRDQGYDVVSFQFLLQNQNDGFEDIYILGGGATPQRVPEPGTLLLLALGILGLGFAKRRRKS